MPNREGRDHRDWIAFILDPEGGLPGSPSSQARLAVAGWQNFAQKHRHSFREGFEAMDLQPGTEPAKVLAELEGLGFPIHHVRGWTRGTWGGRDCYGFHALHAEPRRGPKQFRFAAARVPDGYPDMVFDYRLQLDGAVPEQLWQPRFAAYRPVAAPGAEARRTGLLANVGRSAMAALNQVGLLKATRRELLTDAPEFAAAFLDRARADAHGERLFERSWAVKGGWAVSWYPDGGSGESHKSRAGFMDFLPYLIGLVLSTPR